MQAVDPVEVWGRFGFLGPGPERCFDGLCTFLLYLYTRISTHVSLVVFDRELGDLSFFSSVFNRLLKKGLDFT